MKTQTVKLSDAEKKLLKRAFVIRICFGNFFGMPLVLLFVYFVKTEIEEFYESYFQISTLLILVTFLGILYLIAKFIFPFYKNSYKNLKAENKIIATTVVINISSQITSKGIHVFIETDYMRIDSWKKSFLLPMNLTDFTINSKIEIHHLENNITDIIKIVKL